ncbi:MAG: DUF5602 domain-containing protein [Ginsengibacter sp.]
MKSSIKRSSKWLLPLYLTFFTFISCQKEYSLKDEPTLKDESAKTATLNMSDQETKYNTFKGPEVVVGNGYARTFITRSHTGVPQELGVIFTNEALSGLPATNTPYVLDFHPKALESTLFQHVALGWSANGHPLPGSFISSHFDVRFFMMSLGDRLAIAAPPAPALYVLPPTGYMPANYFPDVPGPQLGMHWTDLSFVAGVPVNHTMILGSYNGKFNFVSPIVTRTELVNGTSILSIPWTQPQLFADHGYYPTKYNIYADDKNQHYVTLSDFVWK